MIKNNPTERLYVATLSLTKGQGDIKERLENAAITITALRPDDIPPKHRGEFNSIHGALTEHPAEFEGEGSIHATIRHLAPDDAAQLADRIFHLYVHVLHGRAL